MEKGLDVFADAIDALRRAQGQASRAGDRRRPGARPGSRSGCPTRSSSASRSAPTSPARSPAPTSSSTRRSPRRSATSRWRRWPARLPVVAAAATGTTSLVRDGETGILVEPGDIDGFADALEAYARDPPCARRHGAAGLAFAKTHGLGPDQLGRDQGLSSGSSSAASGCARLTGRWSYFTRSIRCAASSRIAAISCSSSSFEPVAGDAVAERGHQIADRPADRRRRRGAARSGASSSSRSNRASTSSRILLEMRAAFVGHLERLARSFDRRFLDQAHVLRAASASDRRRPGSAHIRRRSAPRSRGSGHSRGAARRRSASGARAAARPPRTSAGVRGRAGRRQPPRPSPKSKWNGPSRPQPRPRPMANERFRDIDLDPPARTAAMPMSMSSCISPSDVSKIYLRCIVDKSRRATFRRRAYCSDAMADLFADERCPRRAPAEPAAERAARRPAAAARRSTRSSARSI